jgi:hypothetical protein
MSGHGDKLSRKQEQGISALLLQPTLIDAATAIGVDERTLRRWLREHGPFQSAYREARRQIVQQAVVQVQHATGTAVHTLLAVMQDANASASARVSAAKTIIETAIKAVEVEDLEARIAALEVQGPPR